MADMLESLAPIFGSMAPTFDKRFESTAPGAVGSQIDTFKPQEVQMGGNGRAIPKAFIQKPFSSFDTQEQMGKVQGTLGQQQNFVNALAAQGGVGNQANVFAQQQALANQLQQQSMGGGPNPAMAQLSQATGNNMRNQAALMASQRGASHNMGQLAKQASEQGSTIQQQAAGQAATMQAQQQIAAQQALQAQQQGMAGLATNQVGQQAGALGLLGNLGLTNQGQMLGTIAGQNQGNIAMQENINNINAARDQQANALNAQGTMANNTINANMVQQANQIRLQQALGTSQAQSAANTAGAGLAGQREASSNAMMGGALQALGTVGAIAAFAHKGGMITKNYDAGGSVDYNQYQLSPYSQYQQPTMPQPNISSGGLGPINLPMKGNGPKSSMGQKEAAPEMQNVAQMGTFNQKSATMPQSPGQWGPSMGGGMEQSSGPLAFRHNDVFGTNTSGPMAGSGEQLDYGTMNAARGGSVGSKLKAGGGVPGKAKVKGDSIKNDTVNAQLSPGEIVIPRHIIQGKNAPQKAADFVAAILAKKGFKNG